MTDNELIQLFVPIINAGLIDRGFTGIKIIQANQPTQQGVNDGPSIYFYKLMDHGYGFLGRKTEYDTVNMLGVHTEAQYYETTFQCSALAIQDPANLMSKTASDILKAASLVLQSDNTITTLNNSQVGILRITEIRNLYFKDDRGQFEAIPSFDFTLVHQDVFVSVSPVIDTIEVNTYKVV